MEATETEAGVLDTLKSANLVIETSGGARGALLAQR